MARVDLTVYGAGILGLSVAWAAAWRGARVRVVDTVGVGAGASGGVVGALAPHVPEQWNPKKAFQLDSLLMAEAWWAEVAARGGQSPGYGRTGRLQPLADDRDLAQAQARAAEAAELWRGQAEWRVVRATGAPWEPASPTGFLIHDTLSARLHPRAALAALQAAIVAAGSTVEPGAAPAACDAADHPDDPTRPVIWATGVAGLQELSAALGRSMGGGVKGQALTLAHDAGDAPQIFVDGLHIVPHADGTVAIGSTSENRWQVPDSTDAQLDDLLGRARAAMPVLAGAPVVQRWAGLRPRAVSRAPLLGPWPGRPGHYVANGGFKIGFGMAPKIAEVMADLVLDGHDAIPDGFRLPVV